QAEDGIRDFHVTGVQTCALPIFSLPMISLTQACLLRSEFSKESTNELFKATKGGGPSKNIKELASAVLFPSLCGLSWRMAEWLSFLNSLFRSLSRKNKEDCSMTTELSSSAFCQLL